MSSGERDAVTGLVTTVIVIGLFLWLLGQQQARGLFVGPDALQVWARSVLLLVCGSIGIAILVAIVFHIGYRMLTGDTPTDQRDERDREIDRRALTWAWYLLSVGLLGVVVHLALGGSALAAMNLILALSAGAEVLRDATRLWFYRRGG
jgi:hypothetical protein